MEKHLAYKVAEFSSLVGVSTSKAYRLTRSGKIPHIKLGRKIIIPRSSVMEWEKTQQAARGEGYVPKLTGRNG